VKIPEITFVDSGSADMFTQLCQALKGNIKDDTLILNNDLWKGNVKKAELENGLYLHLWNCGLSSPVLLKHEPVESSELPSCNLIYTLTQGIFSFKKEIQADDFIIRNYANTFFTTNYTRAHFVLNPHHQIRALFISMTTEWMLKQFQHSDERITEFILKLNTQQKPLFIFETSDNNENLLLNELFDHIQDKEANELFIHSRILLLLSQFFDKLFIHNHAGNGKKLRENFEKIKKAETIINEHLFDKLPSLKEISDDVEMSETALKRYFKLFYEKNVYEYYLQKKMDLAKRMLIEKSLNINEVASQLGYEKTTNFIDIFKKHFGVLPGSIRKNSQND
jgi:AraC-like DNA-binding protein